MLSISDSLAKDASHFQCFLMDIGGFLMDMGGFLVDIGGFLMNIGGFLMDIGGFLMYQIESVLEGEDFPL